MCISPKASLTIKHPTRVTVGATGDDRQYLANLRRSNENVELLQRQRHEAFLDKQPEFQQEIELGEMRYPYHIFHFKQALKRLNPEETLKVSSSSSILIEDLAACSRILGYPQQSLYYRGQNYLYVTRPALNASIELVSDNSNVVTQQEEEPRLIPAAAV